MIVPTPVVRLARLALEMDEDSTFEENITCYQKCWDKAMKSYPSDVEVRYCSSCGMPLVYDSLAYHEGWHFDTCL